MNEEMTYEMMEAEEPEAEETYEELEAVSGNGIVGKIIGGALVAGAVGLGTCLWVKTKDKREMRAIRKLEKRGYRVYAVDGEGLIETEVYSENEEDAN